MMRWASRFPNGEGSVVDLHSSGTSADARLPLARANLKTAARWSRLLNDIPPPGNFTWDPATKKVTATRGGSTGHVYMTGGESSANDPVDQYSTPDYNVFYGTTETFTVTGNQKFIAARVYAPDLDDQPAWSAITIYQIP